MLCYMHISSECLTTAGLGYNCSSDNTLSSVFNNDCSCNSLLKSCSSSTPSKYTIQEDGRGLSPKNIPLLLEGGGGEAAEPGDAEIRFEAGDMICGDVGGGTLCPIERSFPIFLSFFNFLCS